MSYEAWGDDDDGLDGVRETYRKALLEDGWLDDVDAERLRSRLREAEALLREVHPNRDSINIGYDVLSKIDAFLASGTEK